MKHAWLLVVLVSCGVELEVPDTVSVACTSDADCPGGKVCAVLIGTCVTAIDDQAPSVIGVDATRVDGLRVVFSEPVSCGAAGDVSSYTISPSLAVALASGTTCNGVDDFTTDVVLFTEPQSPGATYTLTASAITDRGGNALASANASKSFRGFGDAPDPTPPDSLAPPDQARLLGASQSLVWTTRPGAASYTIEVATDPDFHDPISASPFTVVAPSTSLLLSGLADITHYWRVRSDLTPNAAVLAIHDFDVLVDTLYVACNGADPCDDSITRNGSRTRPYASVQKALAAAAELSTSLHVANPTVKIAARDGGAAYVGAVVVQWQSVKLLGGFDATFSTRTNDPDATVIEAPGTVLLVNNLPPAVSTLIEGIAVRSSVMHVPVISVTAVSAAFTMRNVAAYSPGSSAGLIRVSGGPPVGGLYDHCRITIPQATDFDPGGIAIQNAAAHFVDTQIDYLPGNSAALTAFEVDGPLPGDVIIEGGTFTTPDVGDVATIFYLSSQVPSAGQLVVRNVTAHAGSGVANYVLFLNGSASAVVESSHFTMAPRPLGGESATVSAYDALQRYRVDIAIRNSIIEAPSCASSTCFPVRVTRASRLEITNSLLLTRDDAGSPLVLGDTNPILTNSVLASADGTLPCVSVDGGFAGSTVPIAMQNNAFVNCIGYDGVGSSGDFAAHTNNDLDDIDGQPFTTLDCSSACGNARVANTKLLAVATGSVFTDLDGADNDPYAIDDNDYHVLPGADVFVRQGGLDSSADVCAPQGQNAACNVPAIDYYGDPRSAPYSIGPDEVP